MHSSILEDMIVTIHTAVTVTHRTVTTTTHHTVVTVTHHTAMITTHRAAIQESLHTAKSMATLQKTTADIAVNLYD